MIVANEANVEVLSDEVNAPIIRFPGRRFPGSLIQGDSLKSMTDLAVEILEHLNAGDPEEAKAVAEELHSLLASRTNAYEKALKTHGIELPYPFAK
jgi:hypothetical protein